MNITESDWCLSHQSEKYWGLGIKLYHLILKHVKHMEIYGNHQSIVVARWRCPTFSSANFVVHWYPIFGAQDLMPISCHAQSWIASRTCLVLEFNVGPYGISWFIKTYKPHEYYSSLYPTVNKNKTHRGNCAAT